METGKNREAFKNLSEQKARRTACEGGQCRWGFSTAPSTGKAQRDLGCHGSVSDSARFPASSRVYGKDLDRSSSMSRDHQDTQTSTAQPVPEEPDSRPLFKASFKKKVATSFDGLGKLGLKLPSWK